MPNLNVCTGNAFTTGSKGELIVAGSNSNPWTLGPIATNNGLNTDPASGLWTAPHGCYGVYQEQTQASLTAAVPFSAPVAAATFANPSSVQRMRLVALMQMRFNVNVVAQTLLYLLGSGTFTGQTGQVPAAMAYPIANPTTGTLSTSVTGTATAQIIVPAGGTATLNPSMGLNVSGGAAGSTVTAWWFDVLFLGWLIDPTQAGGVS